MKEKIVINPQYKELEGFINEVPLTFDEIGDIIQNKRNIIKTIHFKNFNINIKRYRIPIFINQIVYRYFRKSKAQKAYDNAIIVEEKGFNTPNPISYIEIEKKGLLDFSFFISSQLNEVEEVRKYYFTTVEKDSDFLIAFAQYTAKLHDAEILHLDYSPGNILFKKQGHEYLFSLVDINRMKFCKVNINKGCENFSRLFEYDDTSIFIAKEYAKARKYDAEKCIELVLKNKHLFEKRKARKKYIKKLFGKK